MHSSDAIVVFASDAVLNKDAWVSFNSLIITLLHMRLCFGIVGLSVCLFVSIITQNSSNELREATIV